MTAGGTLGVDYDGAATDTTVDAGGRLSMYGGSATDTTIAGGTMDVASGTLAGITFTGTGGITNANFILYGSTNFALPIANWTPLTTNVFDGNGNFNFTCPQASGSPQSFYLLELP